MKPLMTCLSLIALFLSACGPSLSGPSASMNIAQSSLPRDRQPALSSDEIRDLVRGNNAFALDVYHTLRPSDSNLILSPFSVSLALAMTYAGARGRTAAQMEQVLRFPGPERTHPAFNALDLALQSSQANPSQEQQPFRLHLANAIWAEKTHSFRQEFLDTLARYYGAGIHLADFIHQHEAARREINRWVEQQTEDRIQDLVPPRAVTPETRLVLANAIYFKADWLIPFEANRTHDAPFYLLDGSEARVKMMVNDLYLPYAAGQGWQAVELPYVGETTAMTLIVPEKGRFSEIESTLDAATLESILNSLQPESVELGLPKFQFTSEFSLPFSLAALGMTDAFDPSLADFSGMTGERDLFISDILHKAFVAVDEKGTEAAAATAVILRVTAMLPGSNIVLTVDRPFLFLIRDTVHGQILFIGRVLHPAP